MADIYSQLPNLGTLIINGEPFPGYIKDCNFTNALSYYALKPRGYVYTPKSNSTNFQVTKITLAPGTAVASDGKKEIIPQPNVYYTGIPYNGRKLVYNCILISDQQVTDFELWMKKVKFPVANESNLTQAAFTMEIEHSFAALYGIKEVYLEDFSSKPINYGGAGIEIIMTFFHAFNGSQIEQDITVGDNAALLKPPRKTPSTDKRSSKTAKIALDQVTITSRP